MPTFTTYHQPNTMDCGPTCLRMVGKHYGKGISLETLRGLSGFSREGVSLLGISEAAETIGFKTTGVKLGFHQLIKDANLPCVLHWGQGHFVVLPPQKFRKGLLGRSFSITIADPAMGLTTYTQADFLKQWLGTKEDGEELGIALLLQPTTALHSFNDITATVTANAAMGWGSLFQYMLQYRRVLLQVIIGLLVGSLLNLIFPFLTQSIVDIGINTRNTQFLVMVLVAQLMLTLGRTMVEFIRSRLLLYISVRVNLSILSDFWIKLMKLPISYFDTKMTGDILQRVGDHHRIESFLTGSSLNTLFSLVNLLLYSVILLQYDWRVFAIFMGGSVLYFFWVRLFLRVRKSLDIKRFSISSRANTATLQLVHGMQEIKLNGCEQPKRWEWERLQAALFNLQTKSLNISQWQQAGALFINEGKNIFITFFVAMGVINGAITLGGMLAIQYIVGSLNSPIQLMVDFMQQAQDARLSLGRLNEIHELREEEAGLQPTATNDNTVTQQLTGITELISGGLIVDLPKGRSISLQHVRFTYPGAGNQPVLQDVSFAIPEGKITAIVGMSGSGKTTLLKLLLRFYDTYLGEIKLGVLKTPPLEELGEAGINLKYISPKAWRRQCGSVLQDGYIFNDSIAKNIAVADDVPHYNKLLEACRVANILSFIEQLPLGFNTKIGTEGVGVSQGQKQRILIARAVYKNPHYLFLDEATNSLDANNETEIMEQLGRFFIGRTVVIVAHTLSTVKSADNIIVLLNGKIVEQGSHLELTAKRGSYWELVRNQLEMGD